MNQTEWDDIAEDLEYGFTWKTDDLWDERERVYRKRLGALPHEVVRAAIDKLMEQGLTWGPSLSQIITALQTDPGVPSWPEARSLLFGRGRTCRGGVFEFTGHGTPDTNPAYWTEREQEALTRLNDLHPILTAFVAGQGVQHLVEINLDQSTVDGRWNLIRLREDYDRHQTSWQERGTHERAAARLGHRQPRRLAPLADIGLPAPSTPMIGAA